MNNFHKVIDNLYRGAAPNEKDVFALKKMGIERIVSLDKDMGERISRLCKKLGIEQIKHYFNLKKSEVLKQLKLDLKDLLLSKPTFIHCIHGRDRTGFIIARLRVELGMSPEKALAEAKRYGFGQHITDSEKPAIQLMENIVSGDSNSNDDTALDISREDTIAIKSPFDKNYVPMNQWEAVKNPVYNITYQPWYYDEVGVTPQDKEQGFPLVGEENNSYALVGAGLAGDMNVYHSASNNVFELMRKSALQLVTDIPTVEKKMAGKCIAILKMSMKILGQALNQLDDIRSAFEEFPETDGDKIWESRVLLRNLRDQAEYTLFERKTIEKNEDHSFEYWAARFIHEAKTFTSDPDFNKLVNTLKSDISELKKLFYDFCKLYSNLKDKDFVKNTTAILKSVVDQCDQIKDLINERIIADIKKDILAEDWYSKIKDITKEIENDH
jgi:hypothetical protein